MKNFLNSLLLIVVMVTASRAQDAATTSLGWQVTGFTNRTNQETTNLPSRIESSAHSVRWLQKNGTRVYEFDVTGHSGSWPDVQADGEITFQIVFRGQTGSIRFSRQQGLCQVYIDLPQQPTALLPYTLTVAQVAPL